ncbi:hypothetical protein SBA2_120045 [Acidobacteriia bacterium SbA2]|nr:hypothetical protein SBA2_120045 [Acidobacteriia bacterium SbA2]
MKTLTARSSELLLKTQGRQTGTALGGVLGSARARSAYRGTNETQCFPMNCAAAVTV